MNKLGRLRQRLAGVQALLREPPQPMSFFDAFDQRTTDPAGDAARHGRDDGAALAGIAAGLGR